MITPSQGLQSFIGAKSCFFFHFTCMLWTMDRVLLRDFIIREDRGTIIIKTTTISHNIYILD